MFWLGMFFLGPLCIVFVYSFCLKGLYGGVDWREIGPDGTVSYLFTLENYARAFDSLYLKIVLRSFRIAASTTLMCLVLGFPIAYYIATRAQKMKGILLMLVIIPFWTNFLIRTYAWITILRSEGLINNMLRGMGFLGPTDSLPLLYNDFAVHLGMFYGYLPYMILPLYSSIEKMDFRLLEAASDLGANQVQAFLRVTLPLTMPGIVAGSILVFVPALGDFITPGLLGGAKSMMIGNLVEDQFLTSRDWPFGSALSFILMAVVLASLMFYLRVSGTDASRAQK